MIRRGGAGANTQALLPSHPFAREWDALKMEPWRTYQEEAAAHFRSLGMSAETDVSLVGVRTGHNVDVAVSFRRAGMDFLCARFDERMPFTQRRILNVAAIPIPDCNSRLVGGLVGDEIVGAN